MHPLGFNYILVFLILPVYALEIKAFSYGTLFALLPKIMI